MRKFSLLSILLLAVAFIAVQCTKEGPEGPAGATGPQGPTGLGGATGPTGPQGPIGTANVIYSAWIPEGGYADSSMASVGALTRRMIIPAPSVTTTILNQGVVVVYTRNTLSGNLPIPLPWIITVGVRAEVGARADVGKIITYFYFFDTPAIQPTGSLGAGTEFRYVVIPGGVAGKSTGIGGTNFTAEEIKAMPYEKVCQLFNIQP